MGADSQEESHLWLTYRLDYFYLPEYNILASSFSHFSDLNCDRKPLLNVYSDQWSWSFFCLLDVLFSACLADSMSGVLNAKCSWYCRGCIWICFVSSLPCWDSHIWRASFGVGHRQTPVVAATHVGGESFLWSILRSMISIQCLERIWPDQYVILSTSCLSNWTHSLDKSYFWWWRFAGRKSAIGFKANASLVPKKIWKLSD